MRLSATSSGCSWRKKTDWTGPTRCERQTMLIIIVLLAFLSGVYVGSRFFITRE
ncbi:MAG: hypothetical protein ABWY35_11440 [Pseudorhodoplanes sp.]